MRWFLVCITVVSDVLCSDTTVRSAKTTERFKIPFLYELGRAQGPGFRHGKGHFWGTYLGMSRLVGRQHTQRYSQGAVAMWPLTSEIDQYM